MPPCAAPPAPSTTPRSGRTRPPGVALPAPMTGDPILRAALIAVALIVVMVVGFVTWFIVQSAAANG